MALLYDRISGAEKQLTGLSPEAQRKTTKDYAARCQMPIDGHWSDVMSGRKDARPGWLAVKGRAAVLAAEGQRVAVVVTRLDRLGRSMREAVNSHEDLDAIGVEVHSATQGGLVSRVMFHIMASMADAESRLIGERVSDMSQYLSESGWVVGRAPNWGYLWRDATADERAAQAPRRVLDENPDEAPYVRELWQRAGAGETWRSLSRWAASLPLVARGGRTLSFAAVRRILMSPVYVARPGDRDEVEAGVDVLERPVGHWPALVTDDAWRAVREAHSAHTKCPPQATDSYLLTGLIRCPECGGRMVGAVQHRPLMDGQGAPTGESASYTRYRCFSHQLGARAEGERPSCRKSVSGAAVEDDVMHQCGRAIEQLLGLDLKSEVLIRSQWAQMQQAKQSLSPDKEQMRKGALATLATEEKLLANLGRKYAADAIDDKTYQATKADIEREMGGARDVLTSLELSAAPLPVLADLDAVLREMGGWHRALMAAPLARKRAVLARLIATIKPIRTGYGRHEAHITWTAEGRAIRDLADWAAETLAPIGPLGIVGA